MASCVEHGEWELKFLACPKCFKDGDVRQPIYPPDRDFVDSLAIKPIDAWTGQEKMRLHNIATLATQPARPEAPRLGYVQVELSKINHLTTRLKELAEAGSRDAKSLAADAALLLEASRG